MSDTPRTDTVYNKYELHCTSEEVTELNNLARTLERENQQLRNGLRACKEALEHQNRYWHKYTPTLIANSTLHLQIIEKALAHPALQTTFKEDKDKS